MEDRDLFGLSGPNDVAALMRALKGKGVRYRGVKERGNPLGGLFG